MPRERLPMRKIRDVLRLHADKLSKRRIAVSVNLGRTAVSDYIKRATRAGLSWPLPETFPMAPIPCLRFSKRR